VGARDGYGKQNSRALVEKDARRTAPSVYSDNCTNSNITSSSAAHQGNSSIKMYTTLSKQKRRYDHCIFFFHLCPAAFPQAIISETRIRLPHFPHVVPYYKPHLSKFINAILLLLETA
jgi:hypothetical protein